MKSYAGSKKTRLRTHPSSRPIINSTVKTVDGGSSLHRIRGAGIHFDEMLGGGVGTDATLLNRFFYFRKGVSDVGVGKKTCFQRIADGFHHPVAGLRLPMLLK